ncbi:MAG: choice-of-anchor B family protein [Bacteroidia bacterium]
MMRIPASFVFFLTFFFSSISAQVSQNLNLQSVWHDPSLPVHSGLIYNEVWGFNYKYSEYAILGSAGFTHFIDVTDPTAPQEVARFAGAVNSIWRDFKTFGHYAYGVADETSQSSPSGLQIFDYSGLPSSIVKVYDSNAIVERAHNIFIDEQAGRLYIAGSNTRPNGIIVLDLASDPANPAVLASVNLPGGYVHDVYVRNNIAYCSHGFNGLYIYDMTVPTSPALIGNLTSYPNQGYNHSSWLTDDGNFLVFADESFGRPLRILDITDLSNLTIVSTFKSHLSGPPTANSIPHNPLVRGDYAFVSYYQDGIQIYNIRDVVAPEKVAWYDTDTTNLTYTGYDGAWGVYPFLPSHNILGSDQYFGLFVLEFDDLKPAYTNINQDFSLNDTVFADIVRKPENNRLDFPRPDNDNFYVEKSSVRLFPNPVDADQHLSILISSEEPDVYASAIYDFQGKCIMKGPSIGSGQPVLFPTAGITPGVYVLVLEGEKHQSRKKLVIR